MCMHLWVIGCWWLPQEKWKWIKILKKKKRKKVIFETFALLFERMFWKQISAFPGLFFFSHFHWWLLHPPIGLQVWFLSRGLKESVRKLVVGKGNHSCRVVKEEPTGKVYLFPRSPAVKMTPSIFSLTWIHISNYCEYCTKEKQWNGSLLCTAGQALGTAAGSHSHSG